MLTSDKLILVELHKSESARLKKLLGELLGGETSGKNVSYADELAGMGKPVLGYVCNPLSWYLSQWRLGCAGKGEIFKRLTDEGKWIQLNARRANRPVKEGHKPEGKPIPEGWNAEHAKTFWYASDENPEAFREWLRAMLEVPGLRKLIDHGFGASPIGRLAGLMTYQFMVMFVRGAENLPKEVKDKDELETLFASQAITTHFIRAEAISADLLDAFEAVGVVLTDEQRAAVDGLKERADTLGISKFYDQASLRLVAKREGLLNKLFEYTAPTSEDKAAARAARRAAKGEGPVDEAAAEAKKARKAEKTGKAAKAAGPGEETGDDGPKLSKEEKAQKRQAREERQAAKSAKGSSGEEAAEAGEGKARVATAEAKVKPMKAKAEKAVAPKPEKVKRVKNKPVDEDVVDAES